MYRPRNNTQCCRGPFRPLRGPRTMARLLAPRSYTLTTTLTGMPLAPVLVADRCLMGALRG